MENEKFDGIKNYHENLNNLDTLEGEIQNHFENIIPNPDIELLKTFHTFLTDKTQLQGIEYRCLCWLNMIFDFPIEINKPFLSKPIKLDLKEFKRTYLNSEKRMQLFQLLWDFILEKKMQSNSYYIKVIIGGSFTDENNNFPNDIDLGILKPDNIEESDTNFNEIFLYKANLIPKGLDLEFLPESLDKTSFKVFSRLVALGNKTEIRDKLELQLISNSFEPRKIIELKL